MIVFKWLQSFWRIKMTYNKEYYENNREKLIETQKKYNKKHYKPVPNSNPFKARAIKAWKTRKKEVKNDKI